MNNMESIMSKKVFHEVQLAFSQKHKTVRSSLWKNTVLLMRGDYWEIGEVLNLKCCSNSIIIP